MQTFIIFYDYFYGQKKKEKTSYRRYVCKEKSKQQTNKQKKEYGSGVSSTRPHLLTHFSLDGTVAVLMAHAKAKFDAKTNNAKSI